MSGCTFTDFKKAFDTVLILCYVNYTTMDSEENFTLFSTLRTEHHLFDINGTNGDTIVNYNPFSIGQRSNLATLLFLLSNQKKTSPSELKFNLKLNNEEIEQMDFYKYLVFSIQTNLR